MKVLKIVVKMRLLLRNRIKVVGTLVLQKAWILLLNSN